MHLPRLPAAFGMPTASQQSSLTGELQPEPTHRPREWEAFLTEHSGFGGVSSDAALSGGSWQPRGRFLRSQAGKPLSGGCVRAEPPGMDGPRQPELFVEFGFTGQPGGDDGYRVADGFGVFSYGCGAAY